MAAPQRFCPPFLLAWLLLGLLAGPAFAQTPVADTSRADSTTALSVDLPPVTVEAPRATPPSIPSAAHTTILDSATVAQSGAQSVADLLAFRSGAFVKQYGSTGLASLSMRGMGGNQTQVLLDGFRMSNPQTGQLDLSLLPTLLIESVEVQHGAGSARHGSGSLGGTVHLHTLPAQTDATLKIAGGGGAFGERYVSALASGGEEAWTGLLAGRYYRTEGDFPYRNEFLVPSRTLRRDGASAQVTTLYGRGRWTGSDQQWTVSGWWTAAHRGLPGPASARSGGADQSDQVGRMWGKGTMGLGDGLLTLSVQGQRSQLRYRNPPTRTNRTTYTTSAKAEARLQYPLADTGTLTAGMSGGYDRSSLQNRVRRLSGAGFVDASLNFPHLQLEPALRLDAIGANGEPAVVPSPRLGIRIHPLSWEGLELRGLIARAFRYPTFTERYYDPGGTPSLRPEDGWTVEGGPSLRVVGSHTLIQADATVFATRLTDKIVWQPSYVTSGVQVWSPSNVSRVYSRGLELSLRARTQLRSSVHLSGGTLFSHTRAENRANPNSPAYGAQLPYVPTQTLKIWGRTQWNDFSLSASGRLVGERYYSSDESNALSPYQTLNIRAAYNWRLPAGRLSIELQIENVLNKRYQVVRLYPMPPRHATLRLQLTLPTD